ncbi:MAG: hypothetical protein EPN97_08170 [Alphaproteobacteria bacterium]|nr:MAG: hypothetical protein EPN97_08170 [Alphaproteobacteria bacterium]
MTRQDASRGVSLFELAIVMLISGLMLVGIMRLFQTLRLEQELKVTRTRIDKIQQQLDAFADRNERFPCPLVPADGPMAGEPAGCINPDLKPGERDVAAGILPVAALGLTPDEAQDGWGNMFTYAVSAMLTKENGMRGVTPPAGVIGLVNGYGDNVLDKPDSGRYVIISHGPDGRGGFTPGGRAIPCREGTLSARNCHAPVDFVAASWSMAPGPYFFDNIVIGDGSRRQARLLDHLDFCGRGGKYYAPERFYADKNGCVADDKVYGACSIESSYMDHGYGDPFTGDWNEIPKQAVWPARLDLYPKEKPILGACTCERSFELMKIGAGELPLDHPDPPYTPRQDCQRAYAHWQPAILKEHCSEEPPVLVTREIEWKYEYISTMKGEVWKQTGSEWKLATGQGWSILPLMALHPDTGKLVHAKAAAHHDPNDPAQTRIREVVWAKPLVQRNHKRALYACIRK